MFWSNEACQNKKSSWKLGDDWKRVSFAEYFSSGWLNVWLKHEKGAFYLEQQFDSNITDQYTYSRQRVEKLVFFQRFENSCFSNVQKLSKDVASIRKKIKN